MFPWRRLGIRRNLQVMERVLEPGNPAEPTFPLSISLKTYTVLELNLHTPGHRFESCRAHLLSHYSQFFPLH